MEDLRRAPRLLGALAVLLAAASCGAPEAAPAPSTSPTPNASVTRTTVDDRGGVGAKADLADGTCTKDAAGAWTLAGTLKNATGTAVTYTVEASVVNPDGWAVLGATTATATVPAGASAPVTKPAFHTSPTAERATAQCVLRVVRHAA